MHICTQITLPFLGTRPYLHGTTLFDRLSEEVKDGTRIVFKIHKMIFTDTIQLSDSLDVLQSSSIASIEWVTSPGVACAIYVAPLNPGAQPSREVFDEDRIVSNATFAEDSVVGNILCGESPIRTLVALNKALLSKLFDTYVLEGQWFFARLDLQKMLTATEDIRIILASKHSLSLVCCTVMQADVCMGKIYFSWVSKSGLPEI